MSKLKIFGDKAGSVPDAVDFLNSLNDLYVGLIVLEDLEGRINTEAENYLLNADYPDLRNSRYFRDFNLEREIAGGFFEVKSLMLGAISFASPGFWEVFGAFNPLQQIREWIKDRHERKKDTSYRMQIEEDEGMLKNEALRVSIVKDKIEILRSIGVSEEEIQRCMRSLILYPLAGIRKASENGLVKDAELSDPPAPESESSEETW